MAELCAAVLAPAYARHGLPWPRNGWTTKAVEEEREQMLECDFITAPSELVAHSARLAGVAEKRILHTSYGFSPSRLAAAIGIERPQRPPVFAFVGSGSIAKGLDILLEAWEQSGIGGTLLLAGHIDDEIRSMYQRTLARDDVHELGFVRDISAVYAAADVFVFPSQQEGGPQVTYEAAACGLPCIVSPMGAGRVVRHGSEGLVVNPLDVSGLSAAMVTLADDLDLRYRFGSNARKRAEQFTWFDVADRLCEKFNRVAVKNDASRK